MTAKRPAFARAALGAVVAEFGQIFAAFVWVALYSHVIAPGQPMAAYEAHAQLSGPWVSIFAGGAIFYAASRWIAHDRLTALVLFGLYLLIDLAILAVLYDPGIEYPVGLFAVSFVSKAALCYLGGLHAEKA